MQAVPDFYNGSNIKFINQNNLLVSILSVFFKLFMNKIVQPSRVMNESWDTSYCANDGISLEALERHNLESLSRKKKPIFISMESYQVHYWWTLSHIWLIFQLVHNQALSLGQTGMGAFLRNSTSSKIGWKRNIKKKYYFNQ
jgi:hypothetical protein